MKRTLLKLSLGSITGFALLVIFGESLMRALYDDLVGVPTDVQKFITGDDNG